MHIREASPSTFSGSCTEDLISSKLWLSQCLKEHTHLYPNVYVLGSWYGNLAPILAKTGIKFSRLYNVDRKPELQDISNKVARHFRLQDKVRHLIGDCNKLRYKSPSLIVNTSCQDIEGMDWFDRIPAGTVVALQGRDNVETGYDSLKEFDLKFPLSKTLTLNEIKLKDPETEYSRFTKVGIK